MMLGSGNEHIFDIGGNVTTAPSDVSGVQGNAVTESDLAEKGRHGSLAP